MKDKRTYNKLKEHGEDMTLENEVKMKPKTDSQTISVLTDQYKRELKKYQVLSTKQIVVDMAGTIRELHTQNENLKKEIDRLNEEIQLIEMKIKK